MFSFVKNFLLGVILRIKMVFYINSLPTSEQGYVDVKPGDLYRLDTTQTIAVITEVSGNRIFYRFVESAVTQFSLESEVFFNVYVPYTSECP